jgi:hypothetical protein
MSPSEKNWYGLVISQRWGGVFIVMLLGKCIQLFLVLILKVKCFKVLLDVY